MNEVNADPKIIINDNDGVREIVLSHPSRRNALTRQMLTDLMDAVRPEAIRDNGVKAVMLTGDEEGNCFSSGFNLLAIDEDEKKRGLDPIHLPAQALEHCPVPVIAVINGLAMGGALEIAMACDFRIADSETRLGMPPARLGLVYSAEGLLRFLRQVPPSIVKRLFLLGETISAETAKEYRIIDEMYPTEELPTKARKWARDIADHAPMAVEGMLEIRECSFAMIRFRSASVPWLNDGARPPFNPKTFKRASKPSGKKERQNSKGSRSQGQ